jgi:hypothetical protein
MRITLKVDAVVRTGADQVATPCEPHCAQCFTFWKRVPKTLELGDKKGVVESRIVRRDGDAAIERFNQGAGDLTKTGRRDQVLRPQSMNASRSDVTLRIDERNELAFDRSIPLSQQRGNFDDAVMSVGIQPGCLDINDGNASHAKNRSEVNV